MGKGTSVFGKAVFCFENKTVESLLSITLPRLKIGVIFKKIWLWKQQPIVWKKKRFLWDSRTSENCFAENYPRESITQLTNTIDELSKHFTTLFNPRVVKVKQGRQATYYSEHGTQVLIKGQLQGIVFQKLTTSHKLSEVPFWSGWCNVCFAVTCTSNSEKRSVHIYIHSTFWHGLNNSWFSPSNATQTAQDLRKRNAF